MKCAVTADIVQLSIFSDENSVCVVDCSNTEKEKKMSW